MVLELNHDVAVQALLPRKFELNPIFVLSVESYLILHVLEVVVDLFEFQPMNSVDFKERLFASIVNLTRYRHLLYSDSSQVF